MNESEVPGVLPGTMICAGAAIGAGMFALPLASAGMWFPWTVICLVAVCWLSYRSALLLMETGLRFPRGASFDSYVRGTLGPRWNIATGLSIAALAYTLMYAYFSGVGSLLSIMMKDIAPTWPGAWGLMFGALVALATWLGPRAVGRVCTLLLFGMAASFAFASSGLLLNVEPRQLAQFDIAHARFAPVALPVFLTSFGGSPVIPSLIVLYGHSERHLRACLLYGILLSLVVYIAWCAACFGNLDRAAFAAILAGDASIGALVQSLQHLAATASLQAWLNLFSVFAITSSFLALGLTLTDYLADHFGWNTVAGGRLRATLLAFLPAAAMSSLYPRGFVAAIGLAGLLMVFGFFTVPVLMCWRNRGLRSAFAEFSPTPTWILALVLAGSTIIAACHVLAMFSLLPAFP